MKRFFFSLIALSAVAVGCTQSALVETPDLFGTEVSFEPYTGRTPVTKAVSADLDYLKKPSNQDGGFYVYGFLNQEGKSPAVYMNNELVYWDATPAKWNYENIVYWPDASSTSTLSFVAYSANADGKATVSKDGFTFTVDENIDNQIDLLATAYKDGLSLNSDAQKVSGGNVQLQFHHLLSRVGFKVQTSTSKAVTITDLSFGGKLQTTGKLVFTDAKDTDTPALSPSGSKTPDVSYVYLTNNTTQISGATTAKRIPRNGNENDYLIIMPQTVDADGDITISVKYKIGESSVKKESEVKLPANFKFNAGMAYEFVLQISTSSIKFEVTETDWNTDALVPDTQDELTATVKVNTTTKDGGNVDVILIPRKADLGTIGVEYRKVTDPESTWKKATKSFTTYEANTAYPLNISGLDANTEYEYRPYSVKNDVETYYSVGSFITKVAIGLDVNVNGGVTDIKPTEATVYGEFDSTTPGLESKGFCMVPGSGVPTVQNNNVELQPSVTFTHTYTGLQPLNEYTCRAYVIINGVISYSEPTSFWTAPNVTVDPGEGEGGEGEGGEDVPPGPPADSWEDDKEIEF